MAIYRKYQESEEHIDYESEDADHLGHGVNIRITCDSDIGLGYFQDRVIVSMSNIYIREIPAFRGGGAGGNPLISIFFLGIVISISLVGKEFFKEIGKELAKTLIEKFKNQPRISEVYILGKDYELFVLVPTDMSKEDCEKLSDLINVFINSIPSGSKIDATLDKQGGKLIVISDQGSWRWKK